MTAIDGFWLGILFGAWGCFIVQRAAYYNGCNDGYGYSVDPGYPGYWKAGRYLRKYMQHRWPQVMKGAMDDPEYVMGKDT